MASVLSFLLTIVFLSFLLYIFTDTKQVLQITGGGLFQAFGFWAIWSCMVKVVLALSLWLVVQPSSCGLAVSVPSSFLTIIVLTSVKSGCI